MTKHENTERPDTVVRPFAERFHPGAFVKEEMEARGWTTATLAQKSQLREFVIQEICAEHRKITPIVARCLGDAFGTGHEFFINLQRQFDAVARRSGPA